MCYDNSSDQIRTFFEVLDEILISNPELSDVELCKKLEFELDVLRFKRSVNQVMAETLLPDQLLDTRKN